MAEGGEFGREDPDLDYMLDHEDDDDEEQEVNRTQPFQPGASSTPYHGGEQVEMQTMQHEQSGLPSLEETPLLGTRLQEMSWNDLTIIFPRARYIDLESSYGKKGRLQIKMRGAGKKIYDLFTKKRGTEEMHLNPALTKEIKEALGPMAQEIIDKQNESLITERQSLRDAERQLKEAKTIAAEKEKVLQELQDIRQKKDRIQAQIDAIQSEHGSNVESEAELRSLKQLKKNLQTDFEKKKKELAALEKQAKKNRRSTSKGRQRKSKTTEKRK